MATRLQEIIIRVRDTLADPNSERWDDSRLLRLADEGQKLIVSDAGYIRTKFTQPLAIANPIHTLPATTHTITRVLDTFSQVLPLVSHSHADNHFGLGWELAVGPVAKAIVFDKLQAGTFRVYPIPTEVPLNPLTIYGLREANSLALDTDVPELHPVFDRALKFYITGMALRDDKDVQNRQLGAEELQFFTAELRKAMKESAHDFTRSATQYKVPYTGAFSE